MLFCEHLRIPVLYPEFPRSGSASGLLGETLPNAPWIFRNGHATLCRFSAGQVFDPQERIGRLNESIALMETVRTSRGVFRSVHIMNQAPGVQHSYLWLPEPRPAYPPPYISIPSACIWRNAHGFHFLGARLARCKGGRWGLENELCSRYMQATKHSLCPSWLSKY